MTASSSIPDLASLLGDADFSFKFVGEGAANIIFEIIQNKLLRVPKARTIALDYTEVQTYWETSVKPLFQDEDLVNQNLVYLGPSSSDHQTLILSRMQSAIEEVESSRRKDFRGSTVAKTEYAMLVDDMRAKNPGDTVLEFKPKWLSQSPDAPPNAIRCRNCAKEWLRYHDKQEKKRLKPPKSTYISPAPKSPKPDRQLPLPVLCTIDLLNSSSPTPSGSKSRERILERLTSLSPSSRSTITLTDEIPKSSPQYQLLNNWLKTNTLLKRLSLAQTKNDDAPWGGCLRVVKLGQPNPDPGLDLAMTLRDCTCFVRIPGSTSDYNGEGEVEVEVEARLGDLDKKNGPAKLGTWQALERRLIDEGFYTRRRPRGEWTCALEREGEHEEEDEDER